MHPWKRTHQEQHHPRQDLGELAGLLHGVGDRNDLERREIQEESTTELVRRTNPMPSKEKTAVLSVYQQI